MLDWNTYFEQWGATLGAFGATGLIALKTFVFDPIRNRKTMLDLTSFKSVQLSVKDEFKAVGKIMVDSFAEFKEQVMQPMIAELKQKDYQQALANDIIITLLANSSVPLANKEEAFKNLSRLSGMNKELLAKVSAQIEAQKIDNQHQAQVNNQVYDNLNKGV